MTTQLPNGYEAVKVLHLTLKKKWFDMIASGEKKEEYREIKPYWQKRLTGYYADFDESIDFDIVRFKNGYSKNAPIIEVECLRVFIGYGVEAWGAEVGKHYFVIKLGDIIPSSPPSISNHTQL